MDLSPDVEYLIRRGATKGYQFASLATPPLHVAFILARRGRGHISVNRLLRTTWLGGATGELRNNNCFDRCITINI